MCRTLPTYSIPRFSMTVTRIESSGGLSAQLNRMEGKLDQTLEGVDAVQSQNAQILCVLEDLKERQCDVDRACAYVR